MDHLESSEKKTHPRTRANFISNVFFLYTLKIFKKGLRKNLDDDDLYKPPAAYDSKDLSKHLETKWKTLKKQKQHVSIFLLLWKSYGWYYIFLGIIKFCVDLSAMLIEPYCLGKIVSYFSPRTGSISKQQCYLYAALLVGSKILGSVYQQNNTLWLRGLGIKARTAMSSLIYKKILKVNNFDLKDNLGQVLTHITKDVYALETFPEVGNETWILFLTTIIVTTFFYFKVQTNSVAGSLLFWAYVPIQIYGITKIIENKRKLCLEADRRYQRIKETISSMKCIKMLCWEELFETKISSVRAKEVQATQNILLIKWIFIAVNNFLSNAAMFLVFLAFQNTTNITAQTIYYIHATYMTLIIQFGTKYTATAFEFAKFYISARRLELFINLNELIKNNPNNEVNLAKTEVDVKNLNFSPIKKTILQDINFKFEKGITALTGSINSGKSTLFQLIMKERQPSNGTIFVKGNISYASQEPWLFPSTIRQNILFGEEYNEKRYNETLELCCLLYDLNRLEAKDMTIVEDDGHNLSKGQQKRINLARAIYRNSDIYLLDNCLEGLDNQVGQFIFENCLRNYLKTKIVILITQEARYLNKADKIIHLNQQSLQELQKSDFINNNSDDYNSVENHLPIQLDALSGTNELEDEHSKLIQDDSKKEIYREKHKGGSITLRTYHKYLKYGGGFTVFFAVVGAFVLTQAAFACRAMFLSKWADRANRAYIAFNESNPNSTTFQNASEQANNVFKWFAITTALWVFFIIVEGASVRLFFKIISMAIHKKLLTSVLRAPLLFFDTYFVANILNRFSKDCVVVDEVLPNYIFGFLTTVTTLICNVYLITNLNYIFIIPLAVLFIVQCIFSKVYLQTARNLERLEASRRSPIVGYVNSSMEGVCTIRNFKMEHTLVNEFYQNQNCYVSASYTFHCCKSGFYFLMDIFNVLGFVLVLLICLVLKDKMSGGSVGLVLSTIISIKYMLQFAIIYWTSIESQMTSVERIIEYSSIKTENNEKDDGINSWCTEGRVTFKNLNLEYTQQHHPVLKNINLEIKAKEKIVIIGRTGAGKSSFISTLFRLYDYKGDIFVDNVNTKSLSLKSLRTTFSIIPQDAVVFTGSIRDNIDPYRQLSDDKLWKIIKSLNLDKNINDLDFIIDKNSFSDGHKKLLCFARTLARQSKILILDEPNGNLDEESDVLIQEIVKDQFADSTVILITHKIPSNSFWNRMLRLNEGKLVEIPRKIKV